MNLEIVFRSDSFGERGSHESTDEAIWELEIKCHEALGLAACRALNSGLVSRVMWNTVVHDLSAQRMNHFFEWESRFPFETQSWPLKASFDQTFSHLENDPFSGKGVASVDPKNQSFAREIYYSLQKRLHTFDYVFFVERCVLVAPDALEKILEEVLYLMKGFQEDIVLTPLDSVNEYFSSDEKEKKERLIVAGKHRYWRESQNLCRTAFMNRRSFARVWQYFLPFIDQDIQSSAREKNVKRAKALVSEVSPMPGEFPLRFLSPMPALGVLLTKGSPPPYAPLDQWIHESLWSRIDACRLSIPEGIM